MKMERLDIIYANIQPFLIRKENFYQSSSQMSPPPSS